jgi:hypothetical protein
VRAGNTSCKSSATCSYLPWCSHLGYVDTSPFCVVSNVPMHMLSFLQANLTGTACVPAAAHSTLEELRKLLEHPKCVAVGETGLDFNRNFSPPDVQEVWFDKQVSHSGGGVMGPQRCGALTGQWTLVQLSIDWALLTLRLDCVEQLLLPAEHKCLVSPGTSGVAPAHGMACAFRWLWRWSSRSRCSCTAEMRARSLQRSSSECACHTF